MTDAPNFTGGKRLLTGAAAVGVLGLCATGIAVALSPRQALYSYLVAFSYWIGLPVGALAWLMAFHAARARWMVVLRRLLEAMAAAVLCGAVLFVPVALGVRELFVWANPSGFADTSPELTRLLVHKQPYLNVPFFLLRAAVYLGSWALLALLLRRWSQRQDATGALDLVVKQRRLGAGALPYLGLSITFAAFDWMMSLHPGFASTIFGLYYIAGAMVGSMAALILAVTIAERTDLLRGRLKAAHYHSMGKLLLAFVCFWAYMAFSQYMLVWIANLPEELPWYLLRANGPWRPVGAFVALGHFALPFLALLSRDLKERPRLLSVVALWLLFVHWVDTYWLIMPRLHSSAPWPHLSDLTALLGVGGCMVAFSVWRLRGRAPVPVRDPYLADSLRYSPP